ncbi:MAG: 6-phosphofructokinase, partial [Candidatus Altiarchaeota archaeon]|nr:6-phosphofructokinase [Candidatus Altiarchaeota archaeon]
MRVGILTGGGDCPGLNAAIRAVVKKGKKYYGMSFVGIRDGWKGIIEADGFDLGDSDISGILVKGGTILGSSRTNLLKMQDGIEKAEAGIKKLKLDALVTIGGDDTLGVAAKLAEHGFPVV